MSITSSNFISASTLFLRDLLITSITDRQSPSRAGGSWILTGYPDAVPTYPMVIVMAENIGDVKPLGQQSQGTQTDVQFKISIYAKRVVDRDALTQDIHNQLRSNQLTASGTVQFSMFNFRLLSSLPIDEPGKDADHRMILRFKYTVLLT